MASQTATQETKRLSMNITPEIAETLRQHAEKRGITITEFVRQAISTEVYLDEALDDGYQVLLGKDDRPVKELVLRR